jgi:hypothetical protein
MTQLLDIGLGFLLGLYAGNPKFRATVNSGLSKGLKMLMGTVNKLTASKAEKVSKSNDKPANGYEFVTI